MKIYTFHCHVIALCKLLTDKAYNSQGNKVGAHDLQLYDAICFTSRKSPMICSCFYTRLFVVARAIISTKYSSEKESIMGKVVKVYVVDDNGNTLSGQRVKEYGGDESRTGRDGSVSLLLEGVRTTIYVNGNTAYDGSVSRLDSKEVFNKSGGRP